MPDVWFSSSQRFGQRLPTDESQVRAYRTLPMPTGWGEVMSNQYLADIISYLQSLRPQSASTSMKKAPLVSWFFESVSQV